MTQINLFRQSQPMVVVALLQAALPALVSVGSLLLVTIAYGYGMEFQQRIVVLAVLAAALSVALMSNSTSGASSDFQVGSWPSSVGIVARWLVICSILAAVGYATRLAGDYPRRVMLTWAVVNPLLLILANLLLRELTKSLLQAPSNFRSVVFAGCNDVSQVLAAKLRDYPELGMRVSGFFDDRSAARLGVGPDVRLLGSLSELAGFVSSHGTEVIFISLPIRHIKRVLDLLESLRDTTTSIYYIPDIFAFDLIQSRTDEICGIPVVAMCETPFFGNRGVAKRAMDVIVAGVMFLLLLPLMLFIAVVVKIDSPGPILFRQRRYGLDGQQITVYKFRTMTVVEDGAVVPQARRGDERVTRIGAILRRYSLDELPQLVNVLQGRMSIVGPRPHAVAHNEEYRKLIKGYMVRHKVLPGITGLAQVNGCRGETSSVEEMQLRINYDLEYLRRWSLALDLKIILLTALRIFRDEKAY